jgi:hypothetical protein
LVQVEAPAFLVRLPADAILTAFIKTSHKKLFDIWYDEPTREDSSA